MRSFHLLNELSKHHDVDMLAFNQSNLLKSYFGTVDDGIRAAESYFEQVLGAVRICPIPSEGQRYGKEWLAIRSLFTSLPYSINWLVSHQFGNAVRELLATQKYDAVHFDTISLAPYRGLMGRLPCVLDHHNVESHMLLRRADNEGNALKRFYYRQEGRRLLAYEKAQLKRFALHVVCSEEDKNRLKTIDESIRVEVVPNGVLLDENVPTRNATQEKKLLFVGGMSWYPNVAAMHYFLEQVWPILIKEDPEISIDIVGRGPSDRILAYASSDARIRVHGFVDDIKDFYSRAAVYVCPIMDGGGTKLKILDALAHRVPLVAHPVACEGIALASDIHALVAGRPDEMARSILSLINDRERAQLLGDAGYELIKQRYDFRAIGAQFATEFNYLASPGSHPVRAVSIC